MELGKAGHFLCFSHDGRHVATLPAKGTGKAMVWDATTGKAIGPVPDLDWETVEYSPVADLCPDGRILGQRVGGFFEPATLACGTLIGAARLLSPRDSESTPGRLL